MKKVALIVVLALELVVCGCGNSTPTNVTNTQANGNWEAQLSGGSDQTALLNFVTTFSVVDQGPLDITGFGFFNSGACFETGATAESYSGNANFGTNASNQVSGTLSLTITSATNGSVLSLTGNLTGTSNGTTTTTGVLSNGVVVGNWTLTPGTSASGCTGSQKGTFLLCQNATTCTPTTSAVAVSSQKNR